MPVCTIALGGNLGDVPAAFDRALQALDETPGIRVDEVSSTHRTQPVGAAAGDAFHNACTSIDCRLDPLGLLRELQRIENDAARKRDVRWGPRTLDLDLVFYGDQVIRLPELTVPHAAGWYRRFVLDPLVEIAADVVHPEKQATVAVLRERLRVRPFRCSLAGGDAGTRDELITGLAGEFPHVELSEWAAENADAQSSALIVWLGDDVDGSVRFDELPLLPRLDATSSSDELRTFLRGVFQAAFPADQAP